MTEDEMVRWHHGHEFEQTQGDTEGQGSLVSQRVGHDLETEQQNQTMKTCIGQRSYFSFM